jgi:hypothetical protein
MKIGRNIRPREGWVAERVRINAPDLNSVTCEIVSLGNVVIQGRKQESGTILATLCNGLRHKGFVVPEFLSDAILQDPTNTLRYLNMDTGGYVLIDTLERYYNGCGYEAEYIARERAARKNRQIFENAEPPISQLDWLIDEDDILQAVLMSDEERDSCQAFVNIDSGISSIGAIAC